MNVGLRLMEAGVEFVCGGGVCTVVFMSNPTTVLRLCCVVLSCCRWDCDNFLQIINPNQVAKVYLKKIIKLDLRFPPG